jgi:orotidine-5'-phosphate decarboxylase
MKTAKDTIIFPLDVPSLEEAKHYVELLCDSVGMFKVGLELFIQSGPEIIAFIKASGSAGIFLDLKLHDIPATVARAMARIADLGVDFATVHCGETHRMLDAAVNASGGRVGVLGVTVLTSLSKADIDAAGFEKAFSTDLSQLVLKRAAMAEAAGCAGVVCSGQEVKMIKEALGRHFIAVTPGIRPAWDAVDQDDQQRITTPARAIQNGSDYLVIGRPIRDAADPKEAAFRIAAEIESALYQSQTPMIRKIP